MSCKTQTPWTQEEFLACLRSVHSAYHHLHPFHVRMNAGELAPPQIRGWIANRYYYQRTIPMKDAAILSNCPIQQVRQEWLRRITDHDGTSDRPGGIEAWIRLGEAAGLSRAEIVAERHVVPGVRFAVDAYLTLARSKPWQVAVASSLTELFAPELMAQRIQAFERYYGWVEDWGLEYFRSRVVLARRDADEALKLTLKYNDTHDLQEQALGALRTKCEILCCQLDAIAAAYADPGAGSRPSEGSSDGG